MVPRHRRSSISSSSSPRRLPEADDLIFLLTIVLNPNDFIAEKQQQQRTTQSSAVRKTIPAPPFSSTSWQQELSSFPTHRRQIILSLTRFINAYQKWNAVCAKEDIAPGFQNNNHEVMVVASTFASALEEVENTALTIRANVAEYAEASKGYILALRQFWLENRHHYHISPQLSSCTNTSSVELQHVGRKLTTQLIRQIRWDQRLLNAILLFLDEDLYKCNVSNSNNTHKNKDSTRTTEKLRTWRDAMSNMLQIDKSYWEFVQREVYIELTEFDPPNQVEEDFERVGTQVTSIGASLVDFDPGDDENIVMTSCIHSEEVITESVSTDMEISAHERIICSTSVEEAIEAFASTHRHHPQQDERILRAASAKYNCHQERTIDRTSFTSILLLGEGGCGKTHFLDTIQQRYASGTANGKATPLSSSLQILRPNFINDLMGNSVGSTEDRLIALFAYVSQIVDNTASEKDGTGRKCLIMLDDIDRMFSFSNYESSDVSNVQNLPSNQTHVGKSCKALFLTILDTFRNRSWRSPSVGNGHVMLLCTSTSRCSDVADRFDRIFQRGLPDERRRRDIILSCLSLGVNGARNNSDIEDDAIEDILSPIVHHSAGKLDCELAQFCREVILNCINGDSLGVQSKSKDDLKERLRYLDRMLKTKTPQSLRGGSLDGVVDMRVYTPDELQSKLLFDKNGEVHLPLLGGVANRAYEELMNVVITPLCRSDEIRALLYGGRAAIGYDGQGVGINTQPLRVGALLAGGPGVGKTSLVYHCAALAAKMSRVSLLEVSATSLIHKELGGSERAVRRLFAAVRAAAPCILLIDRIESVAPKRGNDSTSEGTMDRVLSTFLTEMDGIESGGMDDMLTSTNIGVIGITHNPKQIDPALLRPGRLEKTITLGTPDYEARKEIAARHIEEVDFDFTQAEYFDAKSKDDVSKYIAMETAGMSAVEIIAICREASMVCLRELNFEVTTKPLLAFAHVKTALSTVKGKARV